MSIDPTTAWTAIGVLLIVLASLWALRGTRVRVGMTDQERHAYWATIDDERGKR